MDFFVGLLILLVLLVVAFCIILLLVWWWKAWGEAAESLAEAGEEVAKKVDRWWGSRKQEHSEKKELERLERQARLKKLRKEIGEN